MERFSGEQARQFRLRAHHLDTWYRRAGTETLAGACGFQNSPPGAWENALHNRIQDCTLEDARQLLEEEKSLLQAWSFRGAPVVFPAAESDAFLSTLVPEQGEPWIYTRGIQLALDALQMPFDVLLSLLRQVIPELEKEVLTSKTALDQSLAEWMSPLLSADKRDAWHQPSMYGNPEKQTVGGAVVSFLLRPCAFLGLVVFGQRKGTQPTFTAYRSWLGHALESSGVPAAKLTRKYLHCYGPASPGGFADWLGCSSAQAQRMWQTAAEEITPVLLDGKERYILAVDQGSLRSPPQPAHKLHLLGGHDPYLGLQDRELILPDKTRQKQIWQTVSNPGAVLWQGEVAGLWKPRKKGRALDIEVTLWDAGVPKGAIQEQAEAYALFQQCKLNRLAFLA